MVRGETGSDLNLSDNLINSRHKYTNIVVSIGSLNIKESLNCLILLKKKLLYAMGKIKLAIASAIAVLAHILGSFK